MKNLAKYFDHTNLKPTGTEKDIKTLCEEAKKYGFASVCIYPWYVKFVKEQLDGTDIKVCAVVGFDKGANTIAIKGMETVQAISDGADEIDMVINRGALRDHKDRYVEDEIQEVVRAAKGKTVKVIIECCDLTDEEKIRACKAAKKAGAHFVKTSTGFGSGGATTKDVKLMKKAFGDSVKAAGGIRTLKNAMAMIKAGATRLGASTSVAIMGEFKRNKNVR